MCVARDVALVIDDQPDVRLAIKLMLERLGYLTLAACDGEEGLRLFDQYRPVLVITDLLMPRREGIETIRAFRGHGHRATVIAVSGGMAARDSLPFALKLGADYAIAKPFGFGELSGVLASLFPYKEYPQPHPG
jgi:DNA-binding response OmpR family regulator